LSFARDLESQSAFAPPVPSFFLGGWDFFSILFTSANAQLGIMGRRKIEIKAIKDDRNRSV